jgi:hypothetical protein
MAAAATAMRFNTLISFAPTYRFSRVPSPEPRVPSPEFPSYFSLG